MGTIKLGRSNSLARSLDYADKRAVEKNGLNCDVEDVKDTKFEMKQVQQIYQKTDKTQAHTIIQTFSPEESKHLTPKQVNQMGIELAEKIAPNHQIAVYTHADKAHLHNHIIVNSVDFENGYKYHHNNDFKRVKEINDKICLEHNLKIITPQKHHEKLTGAEIQMQRRAKSTWKGEIRKKIDNVMQDRSISSYQAFRERLKENGVIVHDRGKNITYELLEGNKKVRGNKLGLSYEREEIKKELISRELRLSKIKEKPLERSPRSHKYKKSYNKKQLQFQFKNNLSKRKNLYPKSKHFNAFKAPKPLILISPYTITIEKVVQVAKSVSRGMELEL